MPEAIENASLGGDKNKGAKGKEIKVYTRKMKHGKKAHKPEVVLEFEPVEDVREESLGEEGEIINENSEIGTSLEDDLGLPIALREKPRWCAQHPIQKYLSYEALSPSYRAFIANVDDVSIPKNIYEALKTPGWKEAVLEEMKALEENGMWEIV